MKKSVSGVSNRNSHDRNKDQTSPSLPASPMAPTNDTTGQKIDNSMNVSKDEGAVSELDSSSAQSSSTLKDSRGKSIKNITGTPASNKISIVGFSKSSKSNNVNYRTVKASNSLSQNDKTSPFQSNEDNSSKLTQSTNITADKKSVKSNSKILSAEDGAAISSQSPTPKTEGEALAPIPSPVVMPDVFASTPKSISPKFTSALETIKDAVVEEDDTKFEISSAIQMLEGNETAIDLMPQVPLSALPSQATVDSADTTQNTIDGDTFSMYSLETPSSIASRSPTAFPTSPSARKVQSSMRSGKYSTKRKNKREKVTKSEEKKEEMFFTLWIDGVPYDYGVICTFCTQRTAIRHCKACNDFYCGVCDLTNHATKKRKDHIRSDISSLTMNDAANIIARAFRLNYHLKMLQRKCREKFRRYFDKNSLSHYYLNTVYNTVSWKKPYCLRKQELFPFLERNYAAARIQGLYHGYKARLIVKELLLKYYRKIFDRSSSRFYYAFNGKSKLIPQSSWFKPIYCGKLSYPSDIPLIYTPDVAALIIQRKWRAVLIRESWRTIARLTYEQVWDPLKGKWNYYDTNLGILYEKPFLFMREQPWDPFNVEEWTSEQVYLFLRRLGLKQYIQKFREYGVIGRTLLLLDEEDYMNMEISNKIHTKKIEVELSKIYTNPRKARATEELIQKRERLRKAKLFDAAATLIQKYYRTHLAKKSFVRMKEIINMTKKLSEMQDLTVQSGTWYTELPNIPSRQYKGDGILLISPESSLHEPVRDKLTKRLTVKRNSSNKQEEGNNNDLKLPILPIKQFGRKRDHLTTRGWGRRGPNNEWIDLSKVQSNQQSSLFENHPTRLFTEKLQLTGYDRRRDQKFRGVAVDAYEYSSLRDGQENEPELLL